MPKWNVGMCLLALVIGCADETGSRDHEPDAGGPAQADDGSAPPARIAFVAEDVQQVQVVTNYAPSRGNRLVMAMLSLTNTGEGDPLPVSSTEYFIETADPILYLQSPSSSTAPMHCPANALVGIGATLSCQVAFEIPWEPAVKRLVYKDEKGRSAAAPVVDVSPPQVLCASFSASSFSCSQCMDDNGNSTCRAALAGLTACGAEDGSGCLDRTLLCPQFRSGCAPSLACRIALDALQSCKFLSCRTSCTGLL